MTYAWFIPVIAGIVFFLTSRLRNYALSNRLIDVPNARSSHSAPTPRGGGAAIVVAFLFALGLLFYVGEITLANLLGMTVAGTTIAVIGFMDDHEHIAARWRLLGHFAAAAWLLGWTGGLPAVSLFGGYVDMGWTGHVLTVFYLVWLINLYNFMDGIDGIASVEAICACLGACLLYWLAGLDGLIWAPLLLAASVAGFLYWNFPQRKFSWATPAADFLASCWGDFLCRLHGRVRLCYGRG